MPKKTTDKQEKKLETKKKSIKSDIKKRQDEKLDILKKIMNEANRASGRTVLKFASSEKPVDRAAFGCPDLDNLTGGGLPYKRFSIIWGPKSAGKTTLCLMLIAKAQSEGKICAFIDIEGTFDPEWAEKMGVDLKKLVLVSGYDNAEEAMDVFIKLTKNMAIDLAFIDSIQALSPKGEQETKKGKEKSVTDDTMALLARKLSQFFRMSASKIYNGNIAVVLVGQARTNLGGFYAFDQLSGGHALHHWSSMTLKIMRGAKADNPTKSVKIDGKKVIETIGFATRVTLEKRKIASAVEGTEVDIPFYYETGFPREEENE